MKRRIAALVVSTCFALLAIAAPAFAVPTVEVVHSETTRVGPYAMRVSFSEWPIRAERSLDLVFEPVGTAVLGAGAAILGWHLAVPLRQLAPQKVKVTA